ncbi:MAG: glycosyltransferase family 2 protein [Candidatus Cloacimonetes bacterium]|nr:glycosyltransferase family 2 protein [Candidatus Cloacimonadota bacterium]
MYSIIIPVYNAEKSLVELYERIKAVFEDLVKQEFELILINDSSRDNSWKVMIGLHERDPRVKIVNLAKNFGQHAALLCGLKHFSGDYVIMLDDDLQHPPEEIPKLIKALEDNPEIDVVFGNYSSKKYSWYRNLGSTLINFIGRNITKRNSDIKVTSFRILRSALAHRIAEIDIQQPRIGGLIMHSTNRVMTVEVMHQPRTYGRSGYKLSRLTRDFISIITGNSVLPLKLISSFGIILSILSMTTTIYHVIRYFIHGVSVVGWTSLIVAITFFSGFILFTLGIIGEYLIRILMEAKKMPVYIERDVIL